MVSPIWVYRAGYLRIRRFRCSGLVNLHGIPASFDKKGRVNETHYIGDTHMTALQPTTSHELIKVNYDKEQPTVSGRELHEFLEVETPYNKWFDRMTEYPYLL